MNKRYALCVGINNYPGVANDLNGCVNDALDWRDLLESEGYDVTLLLDDQATYQNMVTELTRHVALLGFADRFVFTYSGHGTWVPDRSGDEIDFRDEAMCCVDYESGGLLLDDTLESIFSTQRYGARVLVLSDSCHSGTLARNIVQVSERGEPKFVSPALLFDELSEQRAVEIEVAKEGTPRKISSLISGCKDNEYSYDAWFGNRPNGAFSRAAIDNFGPGVNLKTWYTRIRATLPTEYYPQTPQFTSTPYRSYTRAI